MSIRRRWGRTARGGKPTPEGLALLENKNIVLDDVGVADIKAGKIDPRIIGVLTKLSQEHKITVSCMCSDHSKFTAGGSISNHAFGRGLDIAAIDGEIVSPGSPLAREIASELSSFDPSIRPDEIGSPFAINGPGYFTDAAHMNHVHVGFKTELPADFDLPDQLAAGGTAPAAPGAAVAAAPGAPVAPAAPPLPKGESGVFAAVQKPAGERRELASAAAAAAGDPDAKPPSASGVFAVAQAQPAAPAAAAPVEAAADAAATATGPTEYPGDDAPKEQIAAWMAAEAKKRGLPGQLPVMAALVESNLSNVDFGDADSLGYFQMRVSIWERDYPGFADDPEKQIDWFLDTAEGVKAQRVARGQSIDDPSQFGEWIADIERPAEQYRGRYQLRLDEANGLLEKASDAPAAPAPAAPAPAAPAAPAPAAPSRRGRRRRPARARAAGRRQGAGRPGRGREVHGHAVQVGRLDAGDRLRLLRAGPVGLCEGGHPDPARHLRPDRGGERQAGAPRRAAPRRPRLLP